MKITELAQMIGTAGVWRVQGCSVPVVVVDVRQGYGRVDVLVTPKDGMGEAWVKKDSVQILRSAGVAA